MFNRYVKSMLCLLIFPLAISLGASENTAGFDIVKPWNVAKIQEYQGVYHFGESEAESDLLVIVNGSDVCMQIISGYFSDNGKVWMRQYDTIPDGSISGNIFKAKNITGEFVKSGEKGEIKALKISHAENLKAIIANGETGTRKAAVASYFAGRYPHTSYRRLSRDELKKYSKIQLKLMRNEILARYGQRFRQDGEMDAYFKNQNWYSAMYDAVYNFLTPLEKENISMIQKVEER